MRKVLVGIKRVVDFNIKIRVKADRSGIETTNLKMSINPFDEIAIEQAVQWQEQGWAKETVGVSIGPEGCEETLRAALAMGLDKAIHVKTNSDLEPINIAQIFAHLVSREKPRIVILGKQAIDDDCNQTGQMLAALLDWPQGTFASKVILSEEYSLSLIREIDGGLETLELTLPAVITTDLRLNKPRYISLPNIMKAKQKKIETILLETLPLKISSHSRILEITPPSKKKGGIKVASVGELVTKLHEEARVL
jgi:electron transfer flavoprotein beta subunit